MASRLVVLFALLLACTSAALGQTGGRKAVLGDVVVLASPEGGETQVEIVTGAAVVPTALRLSNPERVVLDFADTLCPAARHIKVNQHALKSVRVAQFQQEPPVARVVLDLLAPQEFEVAPAGDRVKVKLRSGGAKAKIARAEPLAKKSEPLAKKSDPQVAAPALSRAQLISLADLDASTSAFDASIGPYLATTLPRIRENWLDALAATSPNSPRQVVVKIVINRDGRMEEPVVAVSSRDAGFDRLAVESVRRSAPFVRLPEEFTGDRLELRCRFHLRRADATESPRSP